MHGRRFILVSILLMMCAAIMWVNYHSVRETKPTYREVASMGAILAAIDNYSLMYGRLPADIIGDCDKPISSWRFAISPYLASFGCKLSFKHKWNSRENCCMATMRPRPFCWTQGIIRKNKTAFFETKVFTISGPNTAFSENCKAEGRDDLPNDTILLISIAQSGVHWMQPGDLKLSDFPERYSSNDFVPGASGARYMTIAFADGEVWQLDSNVPLGRVGTFFTLDGATKNRREVLLGDYCVFKKRFTYIGP